MVTIKDIARKLNLSYSTVSRALNSSSLVNDKTMRVIKEEAERMGYMPNALARGLVLQKSGIIGMIIPDITNPFFPALARGAEDAALARGYNLLVCNSDWNIALETRHVKLIEEKKVDGLILASINLQNEYLEKVIEREYPLVFVSRLYPGVNVSFVGVDTEYGGYLAGRHLAGLGHRKVAFVGGSFNVRSVQGRYKGFIKALAEYGIEFDKSLAIEGEFNIESGYQKVLTLLKERTDITGIFAANDLVAVGIIRAARELGYSIPGDLSIIGYDDIFLSSLPGIELTTIFQEKRRMGELAVKLLLDEINGKKHLKKKKKRIILTPRLIVRKTTGPSK
ncbi:MAG: LacI family transcriptional regulator [Spirochaetes bacterium]|nr:LacI family transcriptional regulator [Spirochaetota bacterium]